MSQKRKLKQNTDLPAALATKIAGDSAAGPSAGDDGRFKKRFKNGAATRKQARKQAREDKKQRKNVSHKRAHGHSIPTPPSGKKTTAPGGNKGRAPATPSAKPAALKKVVSEAEERERLTKFAKRNQGMYQLLRDSNLVDNVDKEAGIVNTRDSAEDLEDRELRRLERNLGIKSNSKLASAFYDEGLGELFDGISFGSKDVQQKSQDPTSIGAAPARQLDTEPESEAGLDDDANSIDKGEVIGSIGDDSESDDAFGLNDLGSDDDGSGSESEDSDIAEMYKSQGIDANPDLTGEYSEEDYF
ncbi:Nucleolar MIF4G domain-containing protein 1, partial [Coemansia aciculifera]